jgi:hypothetical protein
MSGVSRDWSVSLLLLALPMSASAFAPCMAHGLAICPRAQPPPSNLSLASASDVQREARRAFLREAAKHHPDRGGSIEEFVAARREYEDKLEYNLMPDVGVLMAAAAFLVAVATNHKPLTIVISLLGLIAVCEPPAPPNSTSSTLAHLPGGDTPWRFADFFDDAARWFGRDQ